MTKTTALFFTFFLSTTIANSQTENCKLAAQSELMKMNKIANKEKYQQLKSQDIELATQEQILVKQCMISDIEDMVLKSQFANVCPEKQKPSKLDCFISWQKKNPAQSAVEVGAMLFGVVNSSAVKDAKDRPEMLIRMSKSMDALLQVLESIDTSIFLATKLPKGSMVKNIEKNLLRYQIEQFLPSLDIPLSAKGKVSTIRAELPQADAIALQKRIDLLKNKKWDIP